MSHPEPPPALNGPRVLGVSAKNPKCRTVVMERGALGIEATYLPAIVKGIALAAKHFLVNVVARKETETVEYPEERTPYAPRWRGVHRLMLREDGSVRCVACMMCPTVCPARCISIVPGEREDSHEKFPQAFEIDELRCVVCGLCVEACPCDAIRMDTGIHMSPVTERGDAILGKVDLLKRGGPSTAVQGGYGPNWREDEPTERDEKSNVPATPR